MVTRRRQTRATVDKRPENSCFDRDGAEPRSARHRCALKLEHPFLYVNGYGKVRYRGLAKNTQRIALLLGFSNLLIAGRYATG